MFKMINKNDNNVNVLAKKINIKEIDINDDYSLTILNNNNSRNQKNKNLEADQDKKKSYETAYLEFLNNNQNGIYYEYGAHFSYKDLFFELEILSNENDHSN